MQYMISQDTDVTLEELESKEESVEKSSNGKYDSLEEKSSKYDSSEEKGYLYSHFLFVIYDTKQNIACQPEA